MYIKLFNALSIQQQLINEIKHLLDCLHCFVFEFKKENPPNKERPQTPKSKEMGY